MIRNFLRILVLASLLCMSMMAFAQQRISGKVKDSGGEPLIGVNIVEIGTTNGTVTDIDGNYTIRIGKNAKLQFSFIGYVTQELKAKPNMLVILEEDSEKLDEVVVVGYGSMQRKDVTSSITTLKSDDLNSGVMTSPGQMLQGKVPGLVVTTSGNPNAAPSITLRGASTLRTGEAQSPYYIVDGIPGVDLSLVSADDIEMCCVMRPPPPSMDPRQPTVSSSSQPKRGKRELPM